MTRTDEDLYTGITSIAAKKVQASRKSEAERKRTQRIELTPSADSLLDLIDAERAAIPTKLWDLINIETPKADVKSVTIALKMYDNSLSTLHAAVKQILKKELILEEVDE